MLSGSRARCSISVAVLALLAGCSEKSDDAQSSSETTSPAPTPASDKTPSRAAKEVFGHLAWNGEKHEITRVRCWLSAGDWMSVAEGEGFKLDLHFSGPDDGSIDDVDFSQPRMVTLRRDMEEDGGLFRILRTDDEMGEVSGSEERISGRTKLNPGGGDAATNAPDGLTIEFDYRCP